jgi:hypothetical protein
MNSFENAVRSEEFRLESTVFVLNKERAVWTPADDPEVLVTVPIQRRSFFPRYGPVPARGPA